ncbi:MAG: valine--tRNA ligase [Candidatus Micrarchaeota archaeon]
MLRMMRMALSKYNKGIEKKWQEKWDDEGVYIFDENGEGEIYVLDTPPPFTSGEFHMGHVLSYTYFDFVARYKRMRGYNVYYPQGWDCQGFPTEMKVEKKHGRLPREEFRKKCVEWTGVCIERMREQMKALGFSPDWKHEYKTMDPEYHKKVQYSLLKMHGQKLIYRSEHPVYWCTRCGSAIAKAELDEFERGTKLNYLTFECEGEKLSVATTRPEYLHACVAVFVHPDDEKYKKYHGKEVTTSLGKKVKLLPDPDADPEFGTGVVMLCTFGDKQDVVWAYRHKLPIVRAIDEHGRLLNSGEFDGLKLKEAREKVLEKLKEEGKLEKQENINQTVKVHDRCKTPVELILSYQWFANIKDHKDEILKAGKSMKWKPDFTIQYFVDWTNGVEWDWVISRQRVFGTPIPFWHCPKCDKVVPASYDELPVNPPEEKEKVCGCGEKLVPEESTCDCWVDSSITPLIISKWPDDERFFKKTYPSSLRPQGMEIIRTWAFYTTYRCLMLTGKPPFAELLINGNVLAPDGKKMSKSLGNVILPDKLISQYSADAVRQWAALSGALAKDRPFNYKDVQFAQNFLNKLWNASRFVEMALEGYGNEEETLHAYDKWILSRFNRTVKEFSDNFDEFNFHAAISSIHEFFWHEFCDFYLEGIKHRLYQPDKYGEEGKRAAQFTLNKVLSGTLKLLAPIAPFVTEELYSSLFASAGEKSIHLSTWPEFEQQRVDEGSERAGALANRILSEVRQYKAENKMPLNADLKGAELTLSKEEIGLLKLIEEELLATGRLGKLETKEGEFKVSVYGPA